MTVEVRKWKRFLFSASITEALPRTRPEKCANVTHESSFKCDFSFCTCSRWGSGVITFKLVFWFLLIVFFFFPVAFKICLLNERNEVSVLLKQRLISNEKRVRGVIMQCYKHTSGLGASFQSFMHSSIHLLDPLVAVQGRGDTLDEAPGHRRATRWFHFVIFPTSSRWKVRQF